jgi:hypothetical protein
MGGVRNGGGMKCGVFMSSTNEADKENEPEGTWFPVWNIQTITAKWNKSTNTIYTTPPLYILIMPRSLGGGPWYPVGGNLVALKIKPCA